MGGVTDLALENASKKLTMPIKSWKKTMNDLVILFGDRVIEDR
jgi:hypothetical protein